MNGTDTPKLVVSLGGEAHHLARKFATETLQLAAPRTKHDVAKRVYLNTLAIYAVYSYLQWQGYELELEQGDSWHPVIRSWQDTVDLMVSKIGRLGCCWVWEAEETARVPQSLGEELIGYVIIQLGDELNQAKLLGFLPSAEISPLETSILIANLHSLDSLIDYLFRLESAHELLQGDDPVAAQVQRRLASCSLTDIIMQWERIYRCQPKDEQLYAIKDILGGGRVMVTNEREWQVEIENEEDELELLDLAETLLEKLQEIWQNTVV